jgi:hypothetical protein
MSNKITAKETLAKLMATENLLVEHANIPTAAFDIIKRKLLLPNWKNISDSVYTLLISHEVGHALFTPKTEWEDAIMKDADQNFKMVVNIVEDVRIEKMIQAKYPGVIRSFRAGYDELQKANLFGTEGRDINSYGLLDRLNIHFKVGHFGYINVPFSDDERPWLDRLNSCKSFSDVLNTAKELMQYVEQNPESQGQQEGEEQKSSDAGDNGEKRKAKVAVLDENQTENKSQSQSGENSDEEVDAIIDPNNPAHNPNDRHGSPLRIETQESLERSLQNLVDDKIQSNVYVNLPDTQLDKIVVPYKTVHSQIRDFYSRYYPQVYEWASQEVATFKNSSKNVVNQLANLFEMKKKAKLDVRALTAKTGTLDMNRVHSYRYNDDVFKKVTTIPQGKSHGLVMFIDLSSSMIENLSGTYQQLLNLVLFCRRVNIPFEVYGFTDSYDARTGMKDHPRSPNTYLFENRFCLRQYFTNRMTGSEFNDALQNIICMMKYYDKTTYVGLPSQEQLNCTPLNPAIIAGIEVVNQFRKNNGLDIVNAIFLTDGEDTHGISYVDSEGKDNYLSSSFYSRYHPRHSSVEKNYLRDMKTRKQWQVEQSTSSLLNIFKEQTDAKVIGFFLARKRDALSKIEQMVRDTKTADKLMDSYKTAKFAELVNIEGYDAYYIIPNGSGLNLVSDEFDAEIDTTVDWNDQKQAKKAMRSVAREFASQMSEKMVSRVLLNRFIDHIS